MGIEGVVVFCHKKDLFLARICIASVRFFYPVIPIYLVKDYLSGEFSTAELEKAMNVQVLDLGIRKFGWSAAKVHLITSKIFGTKRLLSLDADIVFAGRFLEKLEAESDKYDFIVNPDYRPGPYDETVKTHYYDYDKIKETDPDFVFPGYVFNAGQMVIRTDMVRKEELAPFFNFEKFPFYTRRDILPLVDQSLLNYFLAKQQQMGKLSVGAVPFMEWCDFPHIKNDLSLQLLLEGNQYPFLIHWAGVLRVPHLDKMTRSDILNYFEDFYYSKIPNGRKKSYIRRLIAKADYALRIQYRRLKKIVGVE